MHPLVKGFQVCSNDGPHPFPRGDNYEIEKIHWSKLLLLFLNNLKTVLYFFLSVDFNIAGILKCRTVHTQINLLQFLIYQP